MRMESSFNFIAEGVPAIAALGGIMMIIIHLTMNAAGQDGGGFIGFGAFVFIVGIVVFLITSLGGRGD